MTTTTRTYSIGDRVVVATWAGDAGPGTICSIAGSVARVVLDERRHAGDAGAIACTFLEIKPEPTI